MAREKKKNPGAPPGNAAKKRHDKSARPRAPADIRVWSALNPLLEPPKLKHKSYFEIVENTDKKTKKLEFQVIKTRVPPPGFEFVPAGTPELTRRCKELSREQEAMIFIVSDNLDLTEVEHHTHRLGYHFRESIVDKARSILEVEGHPEHKAITLKPGEIEPIPKSQDEINRQADAVLRDLFPRIPHTDRLEIIRHAFQKDGKFNGEIKVGMAADLPLARRVQLAALAHIRHNHTRYDELLKEGGYENARKAVEKPCLDLIVKWRGDEETGRDQLDEILREVIEISDGEVSSEDESSTEESPTRRAASQGRATLPSVPAASREVSTFTQVATYAQRREASLAALSTPARQRATARDERRSARRAQQRFRRYAAAAEAFAGHPVPQSDAEVSGVPLLASAMDRTPSHHAHQYSDNDFEPISARHSLAHSTMSTRPTTTVLDPMRSSRPLFDDRQTATYQPSGYYHADSIPNSAPMPAYFRVVRADGPKVGPSAYAREGRNEELSPVRHELKDMLLDSIEPASPEKMRFSNDQTARLAQQRRAPPPQVVTRTVVHSNHDPRDMLRRHSPEAGVRNEELYSRRPRVTMQPSDDFGELHRSGFVVVRRGDPLDGRRRLVPVEYVADRPREYASSSAIFEQYPEHSGVPARTRNDPILIDYAPSRGSERFVELHRPPTYGTQHVIQPRRNEIRQEASIPERRGVPDGQRIVYTSGPHSAVEMVTDYNDERSRGPIRMRQPNLDVPFNSAAVEEYDPRRPIIDPRPEFAGGRPAQLRSAHRLQPTSRLSDSPSRRASPFINAGPAEREAPYTHSHGTGTRPVLVRDSGYNPALEPEEGRVQSRNHGDGGNPTYITNRWA